MRKIVLAVVVVLIVAVAAMLASPFFIGLVVQKNSEQIIHSILADRNATIKILDYKRGWFQSTAKLAVTIPGAINTNSQPINLILQEKLQHGPLVKTDTGYKFAKALLVLNSLTKAYGLHSKSILQFNGDLVGKLNIPSWQIPYANKHVDHITDLSSDFVSNIYSGRMLLSYVLGGLQLTIPAMGQQPTTIVSLDNMLVKAIFNWRKPWQNANFKALITKLSSGQDKNISVANGISIQSKVSAAENLAAVQLLLRLDSLTTPNTTFKKIDVDASVSGLSVERLKKFFALLAKLRLASADERQALMPEVNQNLMSMLAGQINLNLKRFAMITDQGALSMSLNVKLPAQSSQMPSYFVILAGMDTDLSVQVTKPWLQMVLEQWPITAHSKPASAQKKAEVQQKISNWIKSGYLVAKGKDLTLKVTYHDGQLMINGNPLMTLGSGLLGGGANQSSAVPAAVVPKAVAPKAVMPKAVAPKAVAPKQ